MAKQYHLVSPFGEVSLHSLATHAHISASHPLGGDWALGWWHAHQAGDEALFARDFWRGQLGAQARSPARTEVDVFVGHWSFTADLAAEVSHSSLAQKARIEAYCQGFHHARKRWSKEAAWTPEDCHLLARTLGFLEWWETRAPQIDFLLQSLQKGLSWTCILELWPELGTEPDRSLWKDLSLPQPFSAEGQLLVNKLRRFRSGTTWTISGQRLSGRPLLAASYVTDVTEPGLPFLPVRIDTPQSSVRGLTLAGQPGFLSGRTAVLAWHAVPAVDDTVDLRILERNGTKNLAGVWAGSTHTGTLAGLLSLEECQTASQAQEISQGKGTASLNVTAVDAGGGRSAWQMGVRWLRPSPQDVWLPVPWGSEISVVSRNAALSCEGPAGRVTPALLEASITQTHSDQPEAILSALRFLLPDTDEGQSLRRWTGHSEQQQPAMAFERLYTAVLEELANGSPGLPNPSSPVFQNLVPIFNRLIQAPHSAWLPSADKNRRLAEAVRRAFISTAPITVPVLGRLAPKSCWKEAHGGKLRIFAATVFIVADPGEPGWRVFHTDDETEAPVFSVW